MAVPKSLKLQLMPPSATTVLPQQSVTQSMKVLNAASATTEGKSVALRLRLKIAYNSVDEVVDFTYANWQW